MLSGACGTQPRLDVLINMRDLSPAPAHYCFVTRWRLAAPIDEVYRALARPTQWPAWWQGLMAVETLAPGDAGGIGGRYRFTWRSRLGYRLCFEIQITRVQPPRLIEARAQGDLEGLGRWELIALPATTEVRYLWQVTTRRDWMNRLAPFARPLFAWNHHALMRRGAEGLARHLAVPLLGVTCERG